MTLVTDITPRHCSRCRRELTDPASRECGVGPICRNKNNHLFAKTIQANVPAASALILGTNAESLPPEVHSCWENLKCRFVNKIEGTEQQSDIMFTGADFRDCVKDIDYILSFHMSPALRSRMVDIVQHLGYPGLAAVLSNEASLSVAKLWFDDGRVFMKGRTCKAGFLRMRKIPGIRTPRYRGHQVPYSAPASQFEEFMKVVQKHWPLYEGDVEDIRQKCRQFVKNNPEAVVQSSHEQKAQIKLRSEDFVVTFPWVRNAPMYVLINEIKTIPSKDRYYDPNTKTWYCKMKHFDHVKNALQNVFRKANIKVIESDTSTPAGMYARRSSTRNRRASRQRRNFHRAY